MGRALLTAVQAECQRRGHQHLLLVCEDTSRSGRVFAQAVGAPYRFSEYSMVLDLTAIDRSRPRIPSLQLRPACYEDIDALACIKSISFDLPVDEVRRETARWLQAPERQYYIGWLDDEPIGSLRVGRYDDSADVTAFCVLPEHRGQGYGRQVLLDTMDILLAEDWQHITIEVVIENQRALGLYQSCGFQIVKRYDFYELPHCDRNDVGCASHTNPLVVRGAHPT